MSQVAASFVSVAGVSLRFVGFWVALRSFGRGSRCVEWDFGLRASV